MSKILIISYRKSQENAKINIAEAFTRILPNNINNRVRIVKSAICKNTYIGILNNEIKPTTSEFISGHILNCTQNEEDLADGSYLKINFNDDQITFNVDRFESKSLWYYQDEDKFIISNSQLIITSLKKTFRISHKAISWFLSSGSVGYKNTWDMEIKKVHHSNEYVFSIDNWQLNKTAKTYSTVNAKFSNEKEFLKKYNDLTKNVFTKLSASYDVRNMILPLSGGNDSRLLFYISNKLKEYKNLTLTNWGVSRADHVFDDKKAALQIAKYYKRELKNFFLPSEILNLDDFFNEYIRNGDCRIDHFNAYTDQFKIFKDLFNHNYKFIIRGDIPFTEGLDLNDKMTRAHIGIVKWIDYHNYNSYVLDDYVEIQQKDNVCISRKKDESLIDWRDRIYINFRIPIVISSFDDLINPYLTSILPMMSYSHYLLYKGQRPTKRGDKNHIVKLSKEMDQSSVKFNASPSILSMYELLATEKNIEYLKDYLNQMTTNLFSKDMIDDVMKKMELQKKQTSNTGKFNKGTIIKILKILLPKRLSSFLKSKQGHGLNPLILAYRMVLVDKVYKINIEATK